MTTTGKRRDSRWRESPLRSPANVSQQTRIFDFSLLPASYIETVIMTANWHWRRPLASQLENRAKSLRACSVWNKKWIHARNNFVLLLFDARLFVHSRINFVRKKFKFSVWEKYNYTQLLPTKGFVRFQHVRRVSDISSDKSDLCPPPLVNVRVYYQVAMNGIIFFLANLFASILTFIISVWYKHRSDKKKKKSSSEKREREERVWRNCK